MERIPDLLYKAQQVEAALRRSAPVSVEELKAPTPKQILQFEKKVERLHQHSERPLYSTEEVLQFQFVPGRQRRQL